MSFLRIVNQTARWSIRLVITGLLVLYGFHNLTVSAEGLLTLRVNTLFSPEMALFITGAITMAVGLLVATYPAIKAELQTALVSRSVRYVLKVMAKTILMAFSALRGGYIVAKKQAHWLFIEKPCDIFLKTARGLYVARMYTASRLRACYTSATDWLRHKTISLLTRVLHWIAGEQVSEATTAPSRATAGMSVKQAGDDRDSAGLEKKQSLQRENDPEPGRTSTEASKTADVPEKQADSGRAEEPGRLAKVTAARQARGTNRNQSGAEIDIELPSFLCRNLKGGKSDSRTPQPHTGNKVNSMPAPVSNEEGDQQVLPIKQYSNQHSSQQ